jgi:hypothetical protein
MVFGMAVVLLMMWRPQGMITRTMLERLRSIITPSRATTGQKAGS